MALEVAPVRGGRDLATFIAFPYTFHRDRVGFFGFFESQDDQARWL